MRKLTAAALLSLWWAAPAQAQVAGPGSWTDRATGPKLHGHGVVAWAGKLYAYGGRYVSPSGTYMFDPVTPPPDGSWTTLSDMPVPNWGFGAAAYDGVLYAFGNGESASGAIYAYSIADKLWSTLQTVLTDPRRAPAAAVLGDRIYLCGGWRSNNTYSGTLEEFAPATGVVRALRSLPIQVAAGMMGAIGDRLYFAGGFDAAGSKSTLYEYVPAGDQWTFKAPLGVRCHGTASFVLQSRLFVAGGADGATSFSYRVFEYSPARDAWQERAQLPAPGRRYSHSGCVIDGQGYVCGGRNTRSTDRTTTTDFNVCQMFTPPDYGEPPTDPQERTVTTSGGRRLEEGGRTPETTLDFSVKSSDPAPGNGFVSLEVEVGRAGPGSFVPIYRVMGTPQLPDADGTITVRLMVGDGDWIARCRVADFDGNANPSGWIRFGGGDVDFTVDLTAPATPAGVSPDNIDIQHGPSAGPAPLTEFAWSNPAEADPPVEHDIRVVELRPDRQLYDVGTWTVEAAPALLPVPPGRFTRYWSVRSRDSVGNVSDWSAPLSFRVLVDDGILHAGGDGERVLGCSTAAGAGPAPLLALAALASASAALLRSKRILHTQVARRNDPSSGRPSPK